MPPQSLGLAAGVAVAGMGAGVAVAGMGVGAAVVHFMDLLPVVAWPPWVMGGVAMR
jgi:hypothetical protein